jgi:hypothetical protein
MAGPQRKPNQTAISVSISVEQLARIDARAAFLGLNRSQYLIQLARKDVSTGGDLILRDAPPISPIDSPQTPSVPVHQTDTTYLKRRRKKP